MLIVQFSIQKSEILAITSVIARITHFCSVVVQLQEGGNATEFDVVFRSHQIKHWKNGKFDAVTTEMTTEIIKLEI